MVRGGRPQDKGKTLCNGRCGIAIDPHGQHDQFDWLRVGELIVQVPVAFWFSPRSGASTGATAFYFASIILCRYFVFKTTGKKREIYYDL